MKGFWYYIIFEYCADQESRTVYVQRVNCAIIVVIRNGTTRITKSLTWAQDGSRIRSVVLHTLKALCWKKC